MSFRSLSSSQAEMVSFWNTNISTNDLLSPKSSTTTTESKICYKLFMSRIYLQHGFLDNSSISESFLRNRKHFCGETNTWFISPFYRYQEQFTTYLIPGLISKGSLSALKLQAKTIFKKITRLYLFSLFVFIFSLFFLCLPRFLGVCLKSMTLLFLCLLKCCFNLWINTF